MAWHLIYFMFSLHHVWHLIANPNRQRVCHFFHTKCKRKKNWFAYFMHENVNEANAMLTSLRLWTAKFIARYKVFQSFCRVFVSMISYLNRFEVFVVFWSSSRRWIQMKFLQSTQISVNRPMFCRCKCIRIGQKWFLSQIEINACTL